MPVAPWALGCGSRDVQELLPAQSAQQMQAVIFGSDGLKMGLSLTVNTLI